MFETTWLELPNHFPHIDLDEFVVMPNHFHGIIVLSAQRRGESCIRPNPGDPNPGDHKDRPYGTLPDTLGRIFQAFKSITTHTYIDNVKHSDWQQPGGLIHQSNRMKSPNSPCTSAAWRRFFSFTVKILFELAADLRRQTQMSRVLWPWARTGFGLIFWMNVGTMWSERISG